MLLLVGLATLPACASSQGTTVSQPAGKTVPVEQPQPQPPSTPVTRTRSVVVHFDSDSADIRAAAMQILYGTALDVRGSRLLSIRVIGHADSSGRRAHNLRLSERRAEAVADQLGKLGLRAEHMEVRGAGEAPAVGRNGKGVKSPADRKVEIVIESVEAVPTQPPSPAHAAAVGHRVATDHASGSTAPVPTAPPALSPAPMVDTEMSGSTPVRLHPPVKPAIKRDLHATGSTWLPPPAA